MSDPSEIGVSPEDHRQAFTEVSFLLEIFTRTIRDLVGAGSPTVCRNAGRHMGKKLPIYLEGATLETALVAVADHMKSGCDMRVKPAEEGAVDVEFDRCPVRAVCGARKQELGGDLCAMYHYYMAGIATELTGKQVKTAIQSAGAARCVVRLEER